MAQDMNKRIKPTLLDVKKRNKTFEEVNLGYTEKEALLEANRCIGCVNSPCTNGCPVGVPIRDFIKKMKANDFLGAYDIIYNTNSLPAVCGRVCPQESQCEAKCVRGIKGEPISIGGLERFCADYVIAKEKADNISIKKNNIKAAIIGSGPAGLTCAGELAKRGYDVTIFEAFHKMGGVLSYGIPEFRLPKAIVKNEIDKILAMGVKVETNTVIGRTLNLEQLFEEGFESIFIGSGAGLPSFMGIEGENLNGVLSANEYLTRINLMKAYDDQYITPIIKSKSVAVVGGGNVAMDAARCAKRLGAESVTVIYRRSEAEMPARREEVAHAKEEGIAFSFLTNPVKINGDENSRVKSIECIKMEISGEDEKGRKKAVAIENSNFLTEVDTVIMAIGTSPNPIINKATPNLEIYGKGCIKAGDDGATNIPGVFAGGDIVTGAATVILAMGAGKRAAVSMDQYLTKKHKNETI